MLRLSRRADLLGTENAFVVLADVNRLVREGQDIVSFCIGQPDFPTPSHIQDAAIGAKGQRGTDLLLTRLVTQRNGDHLGGDTLFPEANGFFHRRLR